eukprot:TRINITY_DN30551_c0_g1_i1.p1 TRINITY_DN30551_c0_g1~~TRINITY_DN30551_c0_g1_i1.p1  ORF type:complete len:182 (+),score=42.47 TRINITY_DN30551_c0_g1_i1:60-548(+)
MQMRTVLAFCLLLTIRAAEQEDAAAKPEQAAVRAEEPAGNPEETPEAVGTVGEVVAENVTAKSEANLRGSAIAPLVGQLDGYIKTEDRNCGDGYGAINIDVVGRSLGTYACGQWCAQTTLCDCIVWQASSAGSSEGLCWRRAQCRIPQCKAAKGYTVFQRFR